MLVFCFLHNGYPFGAALVQDVKQVVYFWECLRWRLRDIMQLKQPPYLHSPWFSKDDIHRDGLDCHAGVMAHSSSVNSSLLVLPHISGSLCWSSNLLADHAPYLWLWDGLWCCGPQQYLRSTNPPVMGVWRDLPGRSFWWTVALGSQNTKLAPALGSDLVLQHFWPLRWDMFVVDDVQTCHGGL